MHFSKTIIVLYTWIMSVFLIYIHKYIFLNNNQYIDFCFIYTSYDFTIYVYRDWWLNTLLNLRLYIYRAIRWNWPTFVTFLWRPRDKSLFDGVRVNTERIQCWQQCVNHLVTTSVKCKCAFLGKTTIFYHVFILPTIIHYYPIKYNLFHK